MSNQYSITELQSLYVEKRYIERAIKQFKESLINIENKIKILEQHENKNQI